jgi:hypothetical protein
MGSKGGAAVDLPILCELGPRQAEKPAPVAMTSPVKVK